MAQDTIHDLTAAYALNALDEDEETRYEAHLGHCPKCRDELASFEETAAALASAVEGPAPPVALRERILTQARSERPNVVTLPQRRWAFPVAATFAAAAATVAVGLGAWAWSVSSSLDEEREARERQETALAVMAGTRAEPYPVRGAEGTLVVASNREAALVLRDLEQAPEGKVYEAWVSADGAKMLPAGTFSASGETTIVPLARPVPAGGLVAVTLEDRPVESPTGEPLFTAQAA